MRPVRFRLPSLPKTQSFGGWGKFVGGRLGSRLGSRFGRVLGRRFGSRFGKRMANRYLPGLFHSLGGYLFPGLPLFPISTARLRLRRKPAGYILTHYKVKPKSTLK